MALYFNILSVLLLGAVAGLLMALWLQLRDWKASVKEAPLLAERMAEQLLAARRGLEDLRKTLVAQGPEISTLISDGGKLKVELQFLLQRIEQVAGRVDAAGGQAQVAQTTLVERVAGANGKAIQPSEPARDPLEDLLAGLQQDGDTVAASNVTPLHKDGRKRRGPVTQAELDLQRKVAG